MKFNNSNEKLKSKAGIAWFWCVNDLRSKYLHSKRFTLCNSVLYAYFTYANLLSQSTIRISDVFLF